LYAHAEKIFSILVVPVWGMDFLWFIVAFLYMGFSPGYLRLFNRKNFIGYFIWLAVHAYIATNHFKTQFNAANFWQTMDCSFFHYIAGLRCLQLCKQYDSGVAAVV
jgi:hypothetical protein